MITLKLKIPPDAVFLFFGLVMWGVSRLVPPVASSPTARHSISIVFFLVGMSLVGSGGFLFLKARTTVDPTKPDKASKLVTSGIYRFTRNPMYLGMLFVLVGWAVFLSNVLSLLCAGAFILYMTEFQIKPEEKALSALFGTEYETFKAKVRRWL